MKSDQPIQIQVQHQRVKQLPSSLQPKDNSRSTPFEYWIDPIADMMYNKGLEIDKKNVKVEGTFVSPLLMDSTMSTASDKVSAVFNHYLGNLMDLKSIYLKPTANGQPSLGSEPILSSADSYSIDSILVAGSYLRAPGKKDINDTLYIWLVWGDSLDANVFNNRKASDVMNPPLSTWRSKVYGPKVIGAFAADGNVIKPKATAPTNMMLIKRVLTTADTGSITPDGMVVKNILVTAGVTIPAGNVVSCFYTFVPQAGSYIKGDINFSQDPTKPQVSNGFLGLIWAQTLPIVLSINDYVDYQVDPTPGCISTGVRMTTGARYNPATTTIYGLPDRTAYLAYKISGISTIGISEFKNEFSLYQNTPNPFTDQTTIAYQLKVPAKSVSLVIYNVAGVKLFDQTQSNLSSGKYSVEVNNTDFASGIYFYTLVVDGNQITKKMVVTK